MASILAADAGASAALALLAVRAGMPPWSLVVGSAQRPPPDSASVRRSARGPHQLKGGQSFTVCEALVAAHVAPINLDVVMGEKPVLERGRRLRDTLRSHLWRASRRGP